MQKYPQTKTFMGFKLIEDDRVPKGFIEVRDHYGRVSGYVFIGFGETPSPDTAPPVIYPPLER